MAQCCHGMRLHAERFGAARTANDLRVTALSITQRHTERHRLRRSGHPGGESGDDGGLPVTGSGTGTMVGVGGVLLLLGYAGYLVGRRRRSRFAA
jgi:LPXTG-motif cell wall-anchored protein